MMQDYADRQRLKTTGRDVGVMSGIEAFDLQTGGHQPGELILYVGFASAGKTTLATQTAWHAKVVQGLNVAFFTTETLRPQVRRKLIARHSMLPQFELPDGLNTRNLKYGTLEPFEEAKLAPIIQDFAENPAYGNLYLAQLPESATVSMIASKLQRVSRMWHVDLCVIDYLALMSADVKRQSRQQELSDIIQSAKILAATHNDGEGVPVISPWQVSRSAYEEATRVGYYTSRSLSDTSEAEKSADVIVSMLGKEEESRYAEVRGQILKNRDGERVSAVELNVDFATCRVEGKRAERSEDMEELLGLNG